jgi:hypothetical protein
MGIFAVLFFFGASAYRLRRIRRRGGVVCSRRGRLAAAADLKDGVPCHTRSSLKKWKAFDVTSKRRKGYPSETRVKRGQRVVHGDKELVEKLGRDDLCPCGSGRRFQALLPADGTL